VNDTGVVIVPWIDGEYDDVTERPKASSWSGGSEEKTT
jgi:hypothetical protein